MTALEIQEAIWYLVNGAYLTNPSPNTTFSSSGDTNTRFLLGSDVAGSSAASRFIPVPGQVVAVIVHATDGDGIQDGGDQYSQDILIEVPVTGPCTLPSLFSSNPLTNIAFNQGTLLFASTVFMTSKSLPATLLEDKVEQYHGPGVYDTGQFFVAVQGGTTLRRWTNDTVHVTVGPGEAFVILPESRLDAEPARVECSRLITPASNYEFQCQGRGDANPALDTSVETVSGELRCAPTPKE